MPKRGVVATARSTAPKRAPSSSSKVPAKKKQRSAKPSSPCPSQEGVTTDEAALDDECDEEVGNYDPRCEGHTKCVVCSASSKSVAWAATKGTGSGAEQRPLGNLCSSCYEVFSLKQSKSLKSVADFVAKAASSSSFRAGIENAKKIKGDGAKEFPRETVDNCLATHVEVLHPHIILTEREVLRVLGKTSMSRLPKYLVKDLTSVNLPSRTDPAAQERNFVFKNPSRPFRELLVKQSLSLSRHRETMAASAQCFEAQGDLVLGREAEKVLPATALAEAFDKSLLNTMPTVAEFVAKIEQKDQKSSKKEFGAGGEAESMDADDDDDGDDNASDISGPLASMYSGASGSGRQLPPVPGFLTPQG